MHTFYILKLEYHGGKFPEDINHHYFRDLKVAKREAIDHIENATAWHLTDVKLYKAEKIDGYSM